MQVSEKGGLGGAESPRREVRGRATVDWGQSVREFVVICAAGHAWWLHLRNCLIPKMFARKCKSGIIKVGFPAPQQMVRTGVLTQKVGI